MMWIMERGGRDTGESRAPVGDFHTDPGKEKPVPQTQLVAVEKLRFWISFLFFFFFFFGHTMRLLVPQPGTEEKL